MRILYAAILLCLGSIAVGQNFEADMKRSSDAYQQTDAYHINVDVVVREQADGEVAKEHARFYKKGSAMRYEIGGMVMLANERYSLWVNHKAKEIMFQPTVKGKPAKAADMLRMNIDSLVNMGGKIAFVGKEAAGLHYRLSQSRGQIATADIWIDAATFFIAKIEYKYHKDEEGRQYTASVGFRHGLVPDGVLFTEKEFLVDGGKGQMRPSQKYSAYRLSAKESPEQWAEED